MTKERYQYEQLPSGLEDFLEEGLDNLDSPPFDTEIADTILSGPDLPTEDEDKTMDLALVPSTHPQPYRPVTRFGAPERRKFAGVLDFNVAIDGENTSKYLYCSMNNRIYVSKQSEFPMKFNWNKDAAPSPMYVRATPVFSDSIHAETKIERCLYHRNEDDKNVETWGQCFGVDAAETFKMNVLRSARDVKSPGVYYSGVPNQADSWYSTVVEFPMTSHGPFIHAYQFVCHHSCPKTMFKKGIDIIFELEDYTGKVYGRQLISARSCSNPKRDMDYTLGIKKEPEVKKGTKVMKKKIKRAGTRGGSRAGTRGGSRAGTRGGSRAGTSSEVKMETAGDEVFLVLPPLKVIGVGTAILALTTIKTDTECKLVRQTNPNTIEKYKSNIADYKEKIDYYRKFLI